MEERKQGMVLWFDETQGNGAIRPQEGGDIPVHYRSIAGVGFRTLLPGQRVEFCIRESEDGPCAVDVILLDPSMR